MVPGEPSPFGAFEWVDDRHALDVTQQRDDETIAVGHRADKDRTDDNQPGLFQNLPPDGLFDRLTEFDVTTGEHPVTGVRFLRPADKKHSASCTEDDPVGA
jgi:hypothetical protein